MSHQEYLQQEDFALSLSPAGSIPREAGALEEETGRLAGGTRDAESLFAAELAETETLSREDEIHLTRQIVRVRRRIRAILRKARKLSHAALADAGRGAMMPEEDFRERETVAILGYAKEALRESRSASVTGLRRPELRAFIADLATAVAEYRGLRDQMIRANVRLVSLLARRYHHPTLTFLDLFQEGTIGLFRAVEKYEPGRNVKFSTYAAWWIWQQLGRASDIQGGLIRVPVHWGQFRRRIDREHHQHVADGKRHRRETLAAEHGLDRSRFEEMTQAFHFVSADTGAAGEDERSLESVLASDAPQPEERAAQRTLRQRLDLVLRQLPPREGLILRQRFGFDEETQTLEEIGARLGVSRERVRQLESRALKQLQELCRSQGLQDYLH
jgi:RNA polymerase sigma factor (sigma-70 family)